MSLSDNLPESVEVWGFTNASDGMGGYNTSFAKTADINARLYRENGTMVISDKGIDVNEKIKGIFSASDSSSLKEGYKIKRADGSWLVIKSLKEVYDSSSVHHIEAALEAAE